MEGFISVWMRSGHIAAESRGQSLNETTFRIRPEDFAIGGMAANSLRFDMNIRTSNEEAVTLAGQDHLGMTVGTDTEDGCFALSGSSSSIKTDKSFGIHTGNFIARQYPFVGYGKYGAEGHVVPVAA
ncbi:hypothetical protein N7471_010347 [Penicillium samsonianum]|uniref:uncharacterized protein n=1 Tax=Penicillium samsonianum TaxID=1882272 RepID=UPI0025488CC1|nr:uncharacterized protein N7471_010347 [Penicillium samsonianum]KAJ6125854.1 hypothetical protein N7471_010347 [Penicillium samsonianum]